MIEQNQRNTIKSVQADTETIYLTFKVSRESFSILRQEREERNLLLKYCVVFCRVILFKHKLNQIRPQDLFLS